MRGGGDGEGRRGKNDEMRGDEGEVDDKRVDDFLVYLALSTRGLIDLLMFASSPELAF